MYYSNKKGREIFFERNSSLAFCMSEKITSGISSLSFRHIQQP